MKKIISVVICIAVILPFVCAASVNDYSLSLPKGFTGAHNGEDLNELSDIFGITEKALQEYYKENNVVFLAANQDNTCQITLCAVENEFSQGAVSFSRLSQSELETIAADLAGDSFNNLGVTDGKDNNRYIKLTQQLTDSGGDYTVTEYLTVCSSRLYTLSIYTSDNTDLKDIEQTVFKSLKVSDSANADKNGGNMLYTVLAAFGIAVFAAVAIYFTVTIIRDLRKKEIDD